MTTLDDIEIIDPKRFPATVAEEIVASIIDVLDENESCSFVLSGGSTPAQVYRRLSRPPYDDEIDWSRVKLFWGDERFVPQESEHSNFRMVEGTLLQSLSDKDLKYFPVNTSLGSETLSAEDYANTIKQQGYYTDGKSPVFDIVLLGIGSDGHTASLFPGSSSVSDTESICISCDHPNDGTKRISLGPTAIFSAKKIFFLVTGEEKAETLTQIIQDPSVTPEQMPATLYRNASGHVTWFCDYQAAAKLERATSEDNGS